MLNSDLNNLNNILIAINVSILTEIEVDTLNSWVFEVEKDYFNAINAVLNARNEANTARNRFYHYALAHGYEYAKVEMKTDTVCIIG